jgi:GR25 family glycosyltransferase involved in LPS biosynthesis
VYVINLKGRTDRWNSVRKAFEDTGLELKRWDAVNGKELSEEYIKSITTDLCNSICSPAMIGCWLSHYNLWKYIVDNKLNNVLILEDDAIPVDNFRERLDEYWKGVPDNWDIIFFGCSGSCDNYPITPFVTKLLYGDNKKVNGNDHLIIPSFPLLTHAYMISYNGAKKLTEDEALKKVNYHIDFQMAKYLFNKKDKNINMYAFTPYLVYQDDSSPSDNTNDSHYVITKLTEGLHASEQISLPTLFSTNSCYIRSIGTPISVLTLLIILIWFILNLFPSNIYIKGVLSIILLYEAYELTISKDKTKTRTIEFELVVMIMIFLVLWYAKSN